MCVVRSAPSMRGPTWWVTRTAGKLKYPKVFPNQPLQTQICTNDGFSTEWLADFSFSITNSHFLKAPNHILKNIYKMAFCLLQNGLS